MIKKILIKELLQAIEKLYKDDFRNLQFEVSERNLCARLALYLEYFIREYDKKNNSSYFVGYFVDVEYNRMEDINGKPIKKSLHYENAPQDTIICDLLIHSRGLNKKQDNLLALEMKRTYNKDSIDSDNKRLMSLISPPPTNVPCETMYNTLLGVFLTCDKNDCKITVYDWDSINKNYRIVIDNEIVVKKQ